MVLWRRSSSKHRRKQGDDPSAIDPLKSKQDTETFGIAYGVGQAIGADPVLSGAAALYAKAEQERRHAEETVGSPHAAGTRAGSSAGERAGDT